MKTNKIKAILAASAIALTSLVVYSCWEVKSINTPAEIKANSEFTLTMNTTIIVKESDRNDKLIAMFCIPADWEMTNCTYSTSGYGTWIAQAGITAGEFVDMEMVPIDDSILEDTEQLPYPQAMEKVYNKGGNYGDVKWVGFIAKDAQYITDLSGSAINSFDLIAKATFKTTDVNYKFFINCWLGNARDGFGLHGWYGRLDGEAADNEACTRVHTKVIEVTGGSSRKDMTLPDMVSTVPVEYRFGDFFCVNLQTNLEGAESALDGKEEVYLCGKAVLADGSTVVVDEVKKENLMIKKGNSSYSKYILPCLFFDIPHDTKITSMTVWFKDKTGNIVERCMAEEGWDLSQASND